MINVLHILKRNSLFKNGALFAFFSFLNSGMNFLLLLVLASFFSTSDYGKLNLVNTFISLLTIFVSLNATGIIAVDFFSKERQYISRLLSTVLCFSTLSFFIFSLILSICSTWAESWFGFSSVYLWFALLICYMQVFSTINLDIWRLEEKPISYGLYSSSIVLANFIGTLILIVAFHSGWVGRLYVQVLFSCLFALLSIVFLIKRGYLRKVWLNKESVHSVLSFGLPLIPHSASIWVRQGLDRYVINYFYLATQVGLYSFAYNFANIIHIIGLAFNATNSVFIYKKLANPGLNTVMELRKQIKMMSLFFSIITMLICGGTMIGVPYFFPVYSDALPYLIPLCISAFFQCIYYLFVNYLFFYKKTRGLMYITFSFSLLHILLSIIFTRYSVLYTAYITMGINILITTAVFLYSRRIYKII